MHYFSDIEILARRKERNRHTHMARPQNVGVFSKQNKNIGQHRLQYLQFYPNKTYNATQPNNDKRNTLRR